MGVTLLVLAADQGGYFATSWGWTALGLLSAAAVVASLGRPAALSWPELAMLGALAGLCAWSALSATWASASVVVPEVERSMLYLVAAATLAIVARRDGLTQVAGGTLAAVAVIAAYSLATRLIPDRLGVYDPIATYRLSQPMGYWNALGLFAAIGALLALGLVARADARGVSAVSAAVIPLLVLTIYFTFSRGAWLVLAIGLAVAIALDRHRAGFATVALALSLPAGGVVLIASRSAALTTQRHSLAQAAHDGHRLIAWTALLVAVSAALGWVVRPLREVALSRTARTTLLVATLVGAATLLVAIAVRPGAPASLARRAYSEFSSSAPEPNGKLTRRLFSVSGHGRKPAWKVAIDMARTHPLRGFGAGTYESSWLRNRKVGIKIVDAHNVYLETLAELGAVGLGLLLVLLLTPLVLVRRVRREPLAPAVTAAYVAFLVHAVIDWDWEVPAVTLAGIFCAFALAAAARGREEASVMPTPRALVLGLATAFAALAVFAQLGNSAVSAGQDSISAGRWSQAERQASKARRWAPWSADPWVVTGEARLGAGDLAGAGAAFRTAIAKSPGDWHSWYELALASTDGGRRRALTRAARLNPLSPEIAGLASVPVVAP